MTLVNYISDCKDFAREIKEHWPSRDDWSRQGHMAAYYTTNGSGWEKTCDNSNGGIDVSWAYGNRTAGPGRIPPSPAGRAAAGNRRGLGRSAVASTP